MAHKPMLRAEMTARALRASQNVKRAWVWVGARCAWWARASLVSCIPPISKKAPPASILGSVWR